MIRPTKIFPLILGLAFTVSSISNAAMADEPDSGAEAYQMSISKHQARKIARSHLRSLGYTRVGVSMYQARVEEAYLSGQGWRVEAKVGTGLPHEPWLIYVDGRSGEILRAYPVAQ